MKRILSVIALALFISGRPYAAAADAAAADPPATFNAGKRQAERLWFEIGPVSFYCGCEYRYATDEERNLRKGKLWPMHETCDYVPKNPTTSSGAMNARAYRIEWEHIVPAEIVATGFGCAEGTRDRCRDDPEFEKAEGNLFNLVPAIGELNGDRLSRPFGELEGEDLTYGTCDFELTKDGRSETPHFLRGLVEPDEPVRGDIARIYFYMIRKYGLAVPAGQLSTLRAWSVADPVDDAGRERIRRIAERMDTVSADFFGE